MAFLDAATAVVWKVAAFTSLFLLLNGSLMLAVCYGVVAFAGYCAHAAGAEVEIDGASSPVRRATYEERRAALQTPGPLSTRPTAEQLLQSPTVRQSPAVRPHPSLGFTAHSVAPPRFADSMRSTDTTDVISSPSSRRGEFGLHPEFAAAEPPSGRTAPVLMLSPRKTRSGLSLGKKAVLLQQSPR
eukprot:a6848_31.p1 GENE.a6848_31~~a6848_31.p1  ORF type:complete len:202 (+),score=45.29 a6848_31:51-608(+)